MHAKFNSSVLSYGTMKFSIFRVIMSKVNYQNDYVVLVLVEVLIGFVVYELISGSSGACADDAPFDICSCQVSLNFCEILKML